MPGRLWEFLLCHLASSPSSPECIPAALGCLLPSPPSLIVLASLETPSKNTCSRFTSVSLGSKAAVPRHLKQNACQKEKESTQRSLSQKDTTTNHTKIKRHSTCTFGGDAIFFDGLLGLFSLFF